MKSQRTIVLNKEIIVKDKVYQFFIYPFTNADTNGFIICVDDVSDLEKSDSQLRQINKMESLSNLIGGFIHDFNNILGGILGATSVLNLRLKHSGQIPTEKLEQMISLIDESAHRADDIVKQILSLSRKKELNFSIVDLNECIKHIISICKTSFDKSVKIHSQYFPEKALINGDLTQITQVLLNLSVNANHAMTIMKEKDWGGEYSIVIDLIQNDDIFKASHANANELNYWKISITDTGVGMSSEVKAKIWDPFFTTKDEGKGTGLGLSMVFNIISQHHGYIDLYSEVGIGTCFTIYLPQITPGSSEDIENTSGNIVYTSKNETILVADDELLIRDTISNILGEAGYKVITTENGREALDIYSKSHNEIDMVLIDMFMPELNGRDAFIMMHKINPDLKAILCSGISQEGLKETMIEMGFKDFISKPFTMKTLTETVYEVLQK
jgi:signal transduction histidine kinase/ActR/RegA family two-component response regulator